MTQGRASRPEATAMRLFVAVDVPERVRDLVERGIAPVRERHPKARWVPPANQHVTLKFLGSTSPRLVDTVTRSVGEVASAHAPFQTRVSELGAFPSARRARVLWVGLEDPGRRLAAIASSLDERLANDFPPEQRPFAGHLTLARFDPPVPVVEELATTTVESPPFPVDRVVLYRSHLRRPAPVYEPLEAFPLTGPVPGPP
ncbi:MAG: RNA 2',3'-cyclic phosphodiesterase [Actinomycetota bacterium]